MSTKIKSIFIGISMLLLLTACSYTSSFKNNNPNNIEKTEEVEETTIDYSIPVDLSKSNTLDIITYESIFDEGKSLIKKQLFPEKYTDIEGVLTFRSNNFRDNASFGTVDPKDYNLEKVWDFTTSSSSFGSGAGWTGQPSIIKWPDEVKEIMNIKEKFKSKQSFVEVIYASLDGKVYFFDLETGEESRNHIDTRNPIKGSVSIDPRGFPILYVGQGIPETKDIGYKIYSLIDGNILYHLGGIDKTAYRSWGALGGENGLFYNIKLNTDFNLDNKTLSVNPDIFKYRYVVKGNNYQGIENSVSIFKNLAYFADNGGSIQCIDLRTMEPMWVWHGNTADDTNASLALDLEEEIPYLYVGTEQDNNVKIKESHFRKVNGSTGEVVWEKGYATNPVYGLNGGFYATSIIGKHDISNLVIVPVAGHTKGHEGVLIAFDKETGEEVWTWQIPGYTWSSPVSVHDKDGKTYIIQCDSLGKMNILEGSTGKLLNSVVLGGNIESSPAVYNDMVVVATRAGKIHGVKVK